MMTKKRPQIIVYFWLFYYKNNVYEKILRHEFFEIFLIRFEVCACISKISGRDGVAASSGAYQGEKV